MNVNALRTIAAEAEINTVFTQMAEKHMLKSLLKVDVRISDNGLAILILRAHDRRMVQGPNMCIREMGLELAIGLPNMKRCA